MSAFFGPRIYFSLCMPKFTIYGWRKEEEKEKFFEIRQDNG